MGSCTVDKHARIYVPLYMGESKEKAGIQLKYILEKRDTFEMYPGKVVHIIGG